MIKSVSIGFLIICIVIGTASARLFNVNSVSTFNNAVSSAKSGDVISWRQGTFKDIDIRLTKSGITLKAEVAGKTIFNGASKLLVSGNNNTIDGFQYLNGDVGNDFVIESRGDRNDFTDIIIKNYFCQKYVVFTPSAQWNTFRYSTFENRTSILNKNIFSIVISKDEPGYHTVSHCKFMNFKGEGNGKDFGVEPIRIGVGFQDGKNISRSVVEYCYFAKCDGDAEIISSKTTENIYRYNTFDDNQYASLVLRHGSKAMVYGNFFINGSGGVRIAEGQGHVIFNNYFNNLKGKAFHLQNNAIDPLKNILIANNTVINAGITTLNTGSTEPENVVIVNNIFSSENGGNLFEKETGKEKWIANIVNGRLGIPSQSGFIMTDPKLKKNNLGYYELVSNSPAIDNSKSFNFNVPRFLNLDADYDMKLDLIKNKRPDNINRVDIGAEEFNNGNVIKPHATKNNTGPRHLQSNNTNVNPQVNITSPSNGEVFNLGETIDISANASDADGTVKRVLFVTNNDTIRYDNTAPYTASFRPTKPGDYTIFANARDNENENGDDQITVTVTEDIKGPNGYTYKTDEKETVAITNTIDIAFGAIGEFTYLFNQTSDVVCEVNSFGSDPVKGFKKRCFTRPSADYTPPFTYVVSVDQNQVVNASGKQDIAFGANGNFKYLMNQTGDVSCDESIFGDDPAKGYKKKCFVRPSADFTPPLGYSLSSNEGETIEVDESLDIAYGVNGKFEFLLNQNNDVTCNNIDFGNDPEKGYIKKCFTRKAVVTSTSDKTSLGEIVVFPNPSQSGVFNLTKSTEWEVLTINGEQISTGDSERIDLSDEANGIYLLKVNGNVMKLVHD